MKIYTDRRWALWLGYIGNPMPARSMCLKKIIYFFTQTSLYTKKVTFLFLENI